MARGKGESGAHESSFPIDPSARALAAEADAVTTIYAPAELSKSRHAKRRRNARYNGEFSHVVGKVLGNLSWV